MKRVETKLDGVFILEPDVFEDARGFFMESYNRRTFRQLGITLEFVQDNHSLSASAGIIRGLHFQRGPMAQSKLVRVLTGAIYDVAVDIRPDSPTFGQWVGVVLSEENKRQLFIPQGFAHGFCTLVPDTQVLYKVDQYYSPEHDAGILWNDPDLAIDWPVRSPKLSEKDRNLPLLRELLSSGAL
jgi:dTDP-4-dehydrorhamnose 3,5-epimerase